MTIIPQKTCSRCAQTKPLDLFPKNGMQCKQCIADYVRNRRQNDPDFHARQLKSQRKSWTKRRNDPAFVEAERQRTHVIQEAYFKDPVWKKKRADYYHTYNQRPDQQAHHARYVRTYRQNRQRTDRTYHDRLMGHAKRGWHKRRALLISNGGSYTQAEWDRLCTLYNHRCVKCGANGPLSVDHVVPLTKGGSNDITNLQPLCRPCNSRKHTKIADYRPFVLPFD